MKKKNYQSHFSCLTCDDQELTYCGKKVYCADCEDEMTHKKRSKDYRKHLKDKCVINQDCFGDLDPDHFKTLGSGGTDNAENILTLCRKHHTEKGQIGATTFAEKYINVKIWLIENGWEFDEFRGKWINARSTHP